MIQTLEVRFGAVPAAVLAMVDAVSDLERLEALHQQSIVAPSIEAFAQSLAPAD